MEITERRKRILYLTKDPELIEKQLSGENLGVVREEELMDKVSTDAYPTRSCFRFDADYMGSQAFTGLKLTNSKWIPENAIKDGNFGVVVAGQSFGCGSSREHFPWSIKLAGVEAIVASSVERICAQNCQNIGLPYFEGNVSEQIKKLVSGQGLPISEAIKNLDQISADIVRQGGLFSYFRNTHPQDFPKPDTSERPMTGPEKIIAKHMGVNFVKPGDTGFVGIDKRFSYEIFFPFSYNILRQEMDNTLIKDPSSIFLFYDHSVLDSNPDAQLLANQMREIAKQEGLKLYDGNQQVGAEGICHSIMLDKHVLPGEIIAGTDSHTCTLGAAGALPVGVGVTEWAAALATNKIRITMPSSIRFNLIGTLREGVMAKDVMLHILSLPSIRSGLAIGKIFEYGGSGLDLMSFDEKVVLTNMSVEGGAFTGFIEPKKKFCADPDAEYFDQISLNLDQLESYVALPGDPRNGIPLSRLLEDTRIDTKIQKAFIGSCTGGKYEDLLAAAKVLEGRTVNKNVQLVVSACSRAVYIRAYQNGLIKIIEEAGGIVVPSACGACVNFGPGSVKKGEQGISATNRNFPGRMGQGDVFLANPTIVAASAVAGHIISPKQL